MNSDTKTDNVWVVTYYDPFEYPTASFEPIVTCFNNKENADKFYSYQYDKHDVVTIDKCKVYTHFKINGE